MSTYTYICVLVSGLPTELGAHGDYRALYLPVETLILLHHHYQCVQCCLPYLRHLICKRSLSTTSGLAWRSALAPGCNIREKLPRCLHSQEKPQENARLGLQIEELGQHQWKNPGETRLFQSTVPTISGKRTET